MTELLSFPPQPCGRQPTARQQLPLRVFPGIHAFTIVELLVSMALLAIILLVTISIVSYTQTVWKSSNAKVSVFRSARTAFESVTKRVSQATLNTYFDYVNSAGKTKAEAPTNFVPDKYLRQSELHFVTGQGKTLVPTVAGTQKPTHALFFQAPLGFASTPSTGDSQLANLLNAVGYYIEYGSDAAWRPSFLNGIPEIPAKKRYRLMQWIQPTEQLGIYNTTMTQANSFDWFKTPLSAVPSPGRPVAENILAAIFWPSLAENDTGSPLTSDYSYDTKAYLAGNAPLSRNQLPPVVRVTLVAVDEMSAARLEEKYPNGTAPLLQQDALFTVASDPAAAPPSQLDTDLAKLTKFLSDEKLTYRVFNTSVPIRQAKFSAN